jgi:hypothetical protein
MKNLEEQKAIVLVRKEELENKRADIYVMEEQAISNALLPFFEGFNPDVYIEVTRGSIYFKADHPDYSYRKELFTLYLRERYFQEGQRYDGVELSYYTTSTKGDNSWEMKRLRMLGDLADIVLKDQHDIVDAANNTANKFKEEYKEVYAEMQEVGKELGEINEKIKVIKDHETEIKLRSEEGVMFNKEVYIELKRNYTARIAKIKIVEVKGKTCTVAIESINNYKTTESRVNIENLIRQVKYHSAL